MSQRQEYIRFEGHNYYAYLNLNQNASSADVKRNFRQLALKWHPDKHAQGQAKDRATEIFQKINEAQEVLSDDAKRRRYDEVWRRKHQGAHRYSVPEWARAASQRGSSMERSSSMDPARRSSSLDGRAPVERSSSRGRFSSDDSEEEEDRRRRAPAAPRRPVGGSLREMRRAAVQKEREQEQREREAEVREQENALRQQNEAKRAAEKAAAAAKAEKDLEFKKQMAKENKRSYWEQGMDDDATPSAASRDSGARTSSKTTMPARPPAAAGFAAAPAASPTGPKATREPARSPARSPRSNPPAPEPKAGPSKPQDSRSRRSNVENEEWNEFLENLARKKEEREKQDREEQDRRERHRREDHLKEQREKAAAEQAQRETERGGNAPTSRNAASPEPETSSVSFAEVMDSAAKNAASFVEEVNQGFSSMWSWMRKPSSPKNSEPQATGHTFRTAQVRHVVNSETPDRCPACGRRLPGLKGGANFCPHCRSALTT